MKLKKIVFKNSKTYTLCKFSHEYLISSELSRITPGRVFAKEKNCEFKFELFARPERETRIGDTCKVIIVTIWRMFVQCRRKEGKKERKKERKKDLVSFSLKSKYCSAFRTKAF